MKQNGLVSNYTIAQYKPHADKYNESKIANELNREFKTDEPYAAVVREPKGFKHMLILYNFT